MAYKLVTKSSTNWQGSVSGELNKLNTFCLFETENEYGFPVVRSSDFTPQSLIPFHMCKHKVLSNRGKSVHFFLDDYKFEQIWTNPRKYIELFQYYEGVIAPTFSVWDNQPYALNVFNMYRSRWLTRFFQSCGIPVLVDARWAGEKTYDFCFSGIEKNSPVILNTVGTKMVENRKLFVSGFEQMLRVIEPSKLFVYGEYMPVKFEQYFDEVKYYPSFWAEKRERLNGCGKK